MSTEQKFSDYVRTTISERGLKYRQVAQRGGISHAAISDIISGKTVNVKANTIAALAKGMGVPEEEVYAAYRGTTKLKNGYEESDFARLYFKHQRLKSKARQKEFERIYQMVERDYDRALLEQEKNDEGGDDKST